MVAAVNFFEGLAGLESTTENSEGGEIGLMSPALLIKMVIGQGPLFGSKRGAIIGRIVGKRVGEDTSASIKIQMELLSVDDLADDFDTCVSSWLK